MTKLFSTFVVLTLLVVIAAAEPPSYKGKIVLFGNLHAHSAQSDDVGDPNNQMSPLQAFTFASQNGIDFLAISDHHKATDSNHRLFMTASEYKNKLFNVANTFNSSHSFIAIPAIEWGNTATGNHVNIFGADELPPDSVLDADYDELYDWAKGKAEFVQFNHPYSWAAKSNRDRDVGNFGIELFDDSATFVDTVDPVVKTMPIITTVKGGHINGQHANATNKTHRGVHIKAEREWRKHLNMGFHISPVANQDTHRTNWGVVTAARTAVWVGTNSYRGLMNGIKVNRVYATEDDELVVVFQVEYKGRRHWMGDTVMLDGDEDDVDVLVRIWQGAGSDGDSTDEGPYTVTIFSDWDGIGNRLATVWDVIENIRTKELRRIRVPVLAGEYIYIQVTEQNGKDNPVGDGEDVFHNSTGAPGADGNRDDMNDSAWTTPIWFKK